MKQQKKMVFHKTLFLGFVLLVNGFTVSFAWGQCANPATIACTASGTISVTAAGAQGLNASGAAGIVTANSVTEELRATNTKGAWAQLGGSVMNILCIAAASMEVGRRIGICGQKFVQIFLGWQFLH